MVWHRREGRGSGVAEEEAGPQGQPPLQGGYPRAGYQSAGSPGRRVGALWRGIQAVVSFQEG